MNKLTFIRADQKSPTPVFLVRLANLNAAFSQLVTEPESQVLAKAAWIDELFSNLG